MAIYSFQKTDFNNSKRIISYFDKNYSSVVNCAPRIIEYFTETDEIVVKFARSKKPKQIKHELKLNISDLPFDFNLDLYYLFVANNFDIPQKLTDICKYFTQLKKEIVSSIKEKYDFVTCEFNNSYSFSYRIDLRDIHKKDNTDIDYNKYCVNGIFDEAKFKNYCVTKVDGFVLSTVTVINLETKNNLIDNEVSRINKKILKGIRDLIDISNWKYRSGSLYLKKNNFNFKFDLDLINNNNENLVVCEEKIENYFITYSIFFRNEDDFVKNLIEFNITKFKESKIYDISKNDVDEKFYKYIKIFESNYNPLMHGQITYNEKIKKYITWDNINVINLEHILFDILESKLHKIIFKEPYLKVIQNKPSKKYENAVNYVLDFLNTEKYNYSLVNGEGLLFGTSVIEIRDKKGIASIIKKINIESYDKTITIWKKHISFFFNELHKEIEGKIQENISLIFKNNHELESSYLVREIVSLVAKNERYAPATALTAALRGKTYRGNADIEETSNCGKFDIYSDDDVKHVIYTLEKLKLLSTVELKGTYGSFDIFKLNNKSDIVFIERCYKLKDVQRKVKNNILLNDAEALLYFDYLKNLEEKKLSDFVSALELVKVKGFLCFHLDDYLNFMDNAPKEINSLLKMKLDVGDLSSHIKKIYKQIVKRKV